MLLGANLQIVIRQMNRLLLLSGLRLRQRCMGRKLHGHDRRRPGPSLSHPDELVNVVALLLGLCSKGSRIRQLSATLEVTPVLEALEHFLVRLVGKLLALTHSALASDWVTRLDAAALLRGVVVLQDARAVLLQHVAGDALHAENFHVQALAVRQRVLDLRQRLLVHLVQVDGQAARRVQSASASVAFEVLGLLVGDEQLQILKVALACKENISVS